MAKKKRDLREVDNALFDAGRLLRGAGRRIGEAASEAKHQHSPKLARELESTAQTVRYIDTDLALTANKMHKQDDAVRNVITRDECNETREEV